MNFFTLILLVTPTLIHGRVKMPRKPRLKENLDSNVLSNEPHDIGGKHNVNFDHEAFLGKNEAEKFEKLSEKEAKTQLQQMLEKIDQDGNGEISKEELVEWMKAVHIEDRMGVVNDHWQQFNMKPTETLQLEQYSPHLFTEEAKSNPQLLKSLAGIKRRWDACDENGDGNLSQKEFVAYLHPSDWDHMHNVLIEEILEEYDTDKDGYVSKKEYMEVVYPNGVLAEEDEPLIVREEREAFEQNLDINKDGYIDKQEALIWLLPHHGAMKEQAQHLILQADSDKNGALSREEVLENWKLFVGSRASNTSRDEL